ncbi:MAG: pantoate--beta-alanine ligase [Armatimonadetes bacterium]|nr:pantoate--beta-alanine ligase [Armatimonadota bacterium]
MGALARPFPKGGRRNLHVFEDFNSTREYSVKARNSGRWVGLVPTMGFLHDGHKSLIQKARQETDPLVVSIFVNPAQFGKGEDYHVYPRDIERDIRVLKDLAVDVLFLPTVLAMYPDEYSTFVEVERLSDVLCGAFRPGHFRGVATVVLKLFNVVLPHKAYFGLKDVQQLVVVRKMVNDLNLPVEIVGVPTVRAFDGLALSSRNAYLTPDERKDAARIYQALSKAKALIEAGERDASDIKEMIQEYIAQAPGFSVEYVSICSFQNLQELSSITGEVVIAVAARLGKARLIDNIIVG